MKSLAPPLPKNDRLWITKRIREIKSVFDLEIANEVESSAFETGYLSIFYLIYAKEFADEKALQMAIVLREKALQRLDFQSSHLTHGLGLHVVARIWKDSGIPHEKYELFLPEIKKSATKAGLAFLNKSESVELFEGATGLALIAHCQQNLELLEASLKTVKRRLVKTQLGWSCQSISYLQNYFRQNFVKNWTPQFTLGIAHGTAGPLLATCFSDEHQSVQIRKKLLDFFLSLDRESPKRLFGNFWEQSSHHTMSAWCGGDAGIGFAITLAAKKEEGSRAVQLRRLGSKVFRRGVKESVWGSLVRDLHFCHGAAGITLLCQRMNELDPSLANSRAYRFWLRKLNQDPELKTCCALPPGLAQAASLRNQSIVSGLTGWGLVLLSAVANDDLQWDRLFLTNVISTAERV